jgi:uncharacterized membrane protein (UPF0182 family)
VFRRAVFASQFGSSKILFSGDIQSGSRILYNRDVMDRAKKALSFLTFDGDPYLVITADGTLKWILDAYTTTRHYPYSERLRDGTSYMRNAVKLVIDAYDGTLTAYISAPGDPLIQTWSRTSGRTFGIPTGSIGFRPVSTLPTTWTIPKTSTIGKISGRSQRRRSRRARFRLCGTW